MTRVTILMATRNGAKHLPAQLNSLGAQTHTDWRLWVSDDGSTDATRSLIRTFAQAHPTQDVRLFDGPCRGAAANFLSLLCHPDLPPGPVALCDQDDVWLRGKLSRALRRIGAAGATGPVLYAAESWLADADLRRLARSATGRTRPSLRNALVQNLCSGHTTVLNEAAVSLIRRAGSPPGIAFHDWWLYQLVACAGGICLLDPTPVALYRQHDSNLFGASRGPGAALRRLRLLANRDYAGWLAAHHNALRGVAHLLAPEARLLLQTLATTPAGPSRAITFCRAGLCRSATLGTAALWCAAALGRA